MSALPRSCAPFSMPRSPPQPHARSLACPALLLPPGPARPAPATRDSKRPGPRRSRILRSARQPQSPDTKETDGNLKTAALLSGARQLSALCVGCGRHRPCGLNSGRRNRRSRRGDGKARLQSPEAQTKSGWASQRLNRDRLRFARAHAYIDGMDLRYWQTALREAEAELDAARTRSELDAAAKKFQRAKAALKELEIAAEGKPKRRSSRGRASAGAFS